MLSLFNTSSEKAGFRLQYMEVYNWGTFNERVFRISPQGNNSLLTGANASGKSTWIDALLTLMVPLQRDRFYNQSSGVEKKGDRTEETYVLGNFGNIQREGEYATTTQALRDKRVRSVILVYFSDSDQRQVTLFQVRWFSNDELKRQFGIAHVPLSIEQDFGDFDTKGDWKKKLDKRYNANSQKRKIEFPDGPGDYAERMANLFGMRSVKALSLFNQIVGVKVLEDLDEFIRTNMLEEWQAEEKFKQLKESFTTLTEAKTNIEKAREQIKQLKPIDETIRKLDETGSDLIQLNHTRNTARYWFAQKSVETGSREADKCREQIAMLKDETERLDDLQAERRDEVTELTFRIKSDEVGNQINELAKEAGRLEKFRDSRKQKLDAYNKIAGIIELRTDPGEETFRENREKAIALEQDAAQKEEEEREKIHLLKRNKDETAGKISNISGTIEMLLKNRNNIAGREAEIRDELIEFVGAQKEEIPFIGELIRVKETEKEWEGAIEKVLHNFAMRLIVPAKYYTKVNQYVNENDLRGRIRYDKYEELDLLKNSGNSTDSEISLPRKLDIKPGTVYRRWVDEQLHNHFNFDCVNSLSEFERYSGMALTRNGLIRFRKGRHEKDDRPHVNSRENHVLGWDNREKIIILKRELNDLQNRQAVTANEISATEKRARSLKEFGEKCRSLNYKFDKYEDIDWQTPAAQIQEKYKLRDTLEKTNDKVKQLQKQLEKTEAEINHTEKVEKPEKNRALFNNEARLKTILEDMATKQSELVTAGITDVAAFETQNPNLLNIAYDVVEANRISFDRNLAERESGLKNRKLGLERELFTKIGAFKSPDEEITRKFRDWRSDVHILPAATDLELVGEYQKMLQRLEKDNLPKYEKKFNDYLHDTISNKTFSFKMFFDTWEQSIRENIQALNNSLREIDFKSKPKTYIQLATMNKSSDEVKEFRKMLNNALPNVREMDASVDGRKKHFDNHIEPLIAKLDMYEWRKKVMDVRSWFRYKAEEFYRETGTKFKTYESMGQLSGGEKAQLTYTILGSAIAYQFGLTKEGLNSNSFRFIAIDEAFKAQDEDKARYLVTLCSQLHLQLLVVTPSDNIHIVEHDISFVHYVERKEERHSWLYDMPIEQFKEKKTKWLNQ
jgi:uncharacterized protein YPO0396